MFRRKPKQVTEPEWLVVGLGNPGPEYAGTRHNVGFDAIELIAKRHGIKLDTRKHRGHYGQGTIEGIAVVLLKPMTYMNLSGQSVSAVLKAFGLKPDRLLVITDDMDLEQGRVRMKPKGGSGGHKGHKSILASVGSDEYPRIKVGIGRGEEGVIDHVLDRFGPHEKEAVHAALLLIAEGVERLLTEGVESATTYINERGKSAS